MPRWPTTVIIAETDFSGCRADILDGENFLSPFKGSVDYGKFGTPHEQIVTVGVKGNAFGVQFFSMEVAKFQSMMAQINAAVSAHETFVVHLVDEIYNINVLAVPDFEQQWIKAGQISEGWVSNVVLRLVSKAANV